MLELKINPGKLTLSELRKVYENEIRVTLSEEAIPAIKESVACVTNIVEEGRVVYGINTGFGLLASERIQNSDLKLLQRSLVLSHSTGVGEIIEDRLSRLIMFLKANSLARGFSGVRIEVIEALMALINANVYPCIPAKGSVGASGDLSPLAHMSLVLIGLGEARYQGNIIDGTEAMKIAGLSPLELEAKEGLALLNGTQVSTAYGLKGLFEAENLFAAAVGCGSLTVEAALASRKPFDPRIHEVRGHQDQIDAAYCYRYVLDETSEISESHEDCGKVQDPYSLRCQPQVMGACLTQLRNAAKTLLIESNAVSDNPLIFTDNGDVISGGNFHAEPVAMANDNIALAIAEMGSIAERRISLMMDTHMSGLPPFLIKNAGVNSGFMIAQVTSAALTSQNKTLAVPSSVDSIPTSANQEDHVSMAPIGGRRLWEMNENLGYILAIEYLASVQGLDFREGLKTSPKLEKVRQALRAKVSHYDQDRFFAPDIEAAKALIDSQVFTAILPTGLFASI